MSDSVIAPGVISRRTLIAGGAAAALSAASYRRVLGANDSVGLGFIGFGLIGKRHVLDFRDQPDAKIVAVAEAHGGRRDEAVAPRGRIRPRLHRLSESSRQPRCRRGRRFDARPLACPHDHDGLRGGKGRLC